MANCAITGANGYVGSRLARYFEEKGCSVFYLTRGIPAAPERHVPYDLDRAPNREEFRTRRIEILIHCAYDFSPRQWREIHQRNVNGSEALFREAKGGGVRKLLYISSQSAFPECRSLYGRAKLETEKIAKEFGAVVIRPGLVYGKAPGGMMGSLVKSVSTHSFLPVIAHPGKSLRLIHDEDLSVLVFELAAGGSERLETPVIAAALKGWSLKDIIETLARKAGRSVFLIPIPWFLIWACLKLLESFGINTAFRSDSVLTLAYPNADPDADAVRLPDIQFREFPAMTTLAERETQ